MNLHDHLVHWAIHAGVGESHLEELIRQLGLDKEPDNCPTPWTYVRCLEDLIKAVGRKRKVAYWKAVDIVRSMLTGILGTAGRAKLISMEVLDPGVKKAFRGASLVHNVRVIFGRPGWADIRFYPRNSLTASMCVDVFENTDTNATDSRLGSYESDDRTRGESWES